jgi:hypothetical protein
MKGQMEEKLVHENQPQAYKLYARGEELWLEVLAGRAALYVVRMKLDETERAEWKAQSAAAAELLTML